MENNVHPTGLPLTIFRVFELPNKLVLSNGYWKQRKQLDLSLGNDIKISLDSIDNSLGENDNLKKLIAMNSPPNILLKFLSTQFKINTKISFKVQILKSWSLNDIFFITG